MRSMLTRSLLLTIAVFAWAMPGFAAQTFTVAITAVPGSVTGTVSGVPLPTSLPFSAPIINIVGGCSVTGNFDAAIVNGGLEVELDITVTGTSCGSTKEEATLELEMVVPELGGTVTMVRLNTVPLVTNFPVIDIATSRGFAVSGEGVTTSVDGTWHAQFGTATWEWDPAHSEYPTPPLDLQRMIPLIPGDTLRFPFAAELRMQDASSFVGTFRMRYEFLVTLPEPSAALSLPIGVVTLFGLASLRG
jgi:hypothetical protein